jgi:hypothetical protein
MSTTDDKALAVLGEARLLMLSLAELLERILRNREESAEPQPPAEFGGFGFPGVGGAIFDLILEEEEKQKKACREGRLLARYAHWECRTGRWANVQYGEYQCPDGSIQRIEEDVLHTSDPCGTPDVNHMSAAELQSLLGADGRVVEALMAARPFKSPDDLFRNRQLLEVAAEEDLFRVAVWMWRRTRLVGMHTRSETSMVWHPVGVWSGSSREEDGSERLFLRTAAGAELISARVDPENPSEPDEWSYRLGGYRPWELMQLEDVEVEALRALLYSREAWSAAMLWQSNALIRGNEHRQMMVRGLSSTLGSLLFKAGAHRMAYNLYGYTNNGCTVVPDWNREFLECCELHDACYGRSGTAADRAACDTALFECLRKKGFTGRAWVYLFGCRVFGWAVFDHTDRPTTNTIAARVAIASPGGGIGPCSYEIRLNRIFYDGQDIGSDMRFEITADLARQNASGRPTQRVTTPSRPFRHRQSHNFNDPGLLVYAGSPGDCGEQVIVPIFLTQTNGGPEGTIHDVSFICNGATYTIDLSLELKRTTFTLATERAIMRFHFTITTSC